jgi:hypothetical protein
MNSTIIDLPVPSPDFKNNAVGIFLPVNALENQFKTYSDDLGSFEHQTDFI